MNLRTVEDARPWRDVASCGQIDDPDIFFPGRRDSAAAALAICAGCPALDRCAEHALAAREPHGVWGGQTELERRDADAGGRRPRARASPGPDPVAGVGQRRRRVGV